MDHNQARMIMGPDFLGPEEVERAFGVEYTNADRMQLEQVPLYEEHVYFVRNGDYLLVAGFPMNGVSVRWFLFRKEMVLGSTFKRWHEQKDLAPYCEIIPFAHDVVFVSLLLFKLTGRRLFENTFVRCRGGQLAVGGFKYTDEPYVNDYWLDGRNHGIGIASLMTLYPR